MGERIGVIGEEQEMFARLVPEEFVHDPSDPDRTTAIIDSLVDIDRSRFPADQSFPRYEFERALLNTVPVKGQIRKRTTVILVSDPKDSSIFGFTYADPARTVYGYGEGMYRTRRKNPHLGTTAYITNTVFRTSGSGVISRLMPVLEGALLAQGYEYIERDAAVAHNYAANIIKNNADRILDTQAHESPFGDQMFIRMRIPQPQNG